MSIAIAIAVLASLLAAGVGVVAFLALPTLLILLSWIMIEAVVRGMRRRSARSARTAKIAER
jgi:Na+-transporting methylmalonyl-CoA/oxaloacetate decarboxylase gamma subunit